MNEYEYSDDFTDEITHLELTEWFNAVGSGVLCILLTSSQEDAERLSIDLRNTNMSSRPVTTEVYGRHIRAANLSIPVWLVIVRNKRRGVEDRV